MFGDLTLTSTREWQLRGQTSSHLKVPLLGGLCTAALLVRPSPLLTSLLQ